MKQYERKRREQLYLQYNQRLNKLLEIVLKQVQSCNIPVSKNINPNVFINTRAKKRYGACQMIKKNGKKEYTIQISSRLFNSDDKIIQGVIAHEIIHTCNGAMNHGEKWKRYASIINEKYGYNIKRTSTPEEMGLVDEADNQNENKNSDELDRRKLSESNYVIKCRQCGNIIYRVRASNVVKHPENYRCKCGGKLDVYILK